MTIGGRGEGTGDDWGDDWGEGMGWVSLWRFCDILYLYVIFTIVNVVIENILEKKHWVVVLTAHA